MARTASVQVEKTVLLKELDRAKKEYVVKMIDYHKSRRPPAGPARLKVKQEAKRLQKAYTAWANDPFDDNKLAEIESASRNLRSERKNLAYATTTKADINTSSFDDAIALIKLSCDEKFRISSSSNIGQLLGL